MKAGISEQFFVPFKQFFSSDSPGAGKRRSVTGLLMGVLLLPVLLGVLACFGLPVPIGDPERSQVDPSMSGVWVVSEEEDGSAFGGLVVLDPYDKRTWLMSMISIQEDAATDSTEPAPSILESFLAAARDGELKIEEVALFKSWLTDIGGTPFMTWEPLSPLTVSPGQKPEEWWSYRVRKTSSDQFSLDGFDTSKDDMDEAVSSAEAEEIIRQNLEDPEFFMEILTFHRLPESEHETVAELLRQFGLVDW
jgi:hypothetical protein